MLFNDQTPSFHYFRIYKDPLKAPTHTWIVKKYYQPGRRPLLSTILWSLMSTKVNIFPFSTFLILITFFDTLPRKLLEIFANVCNITFNFKFQQSHLYYIKKNIDNIYHQKCWFAISICKEPIHKTASEKGFPRT